MPGPPKRLMGSLLQMIARLTSHRFLLATRKVSFRYRGVSRMQTFCSPVEKITVLFAGIRKLQTSLERYVFKCLGSRFH